MRIPERTPPPPSFCCCALIANLAHALATATNTINRLLFFMYLFIYFLFINENYPRHRITNNFRFAVPKVERDKLIHLFTIGPKRGPFHNNWISVNCDSTFVYLCVFSYCYCTFILFLVKSETFARCTQIATINNLTKPTIQSESSDSPCERFRFGCETCLC